MRLKQLTVHPMTLLSLLFTLLITFLLNTLLYVAPLSAQESTGSQTDTSAITADQVNEIARELWCPLCSGVRLDSCELKACEQMKEVIALKLAEGEDLDAIRTYFVGQYGPQVLGEPPREGFNWLAWVLPFVVLAIGGYVLLTTIKRMTRPVAVPVVTTTTVTSPDANQDDPATDEYQTKLAEELKRYG